MREFSDKREWNCLPRLRHRGEQRAHGCLYVAQEFVDLALLPRSSTACNKPGPHSVRPCSFIFPGWSRLLINSACRWYALMHSGDLIFSQWKFTQIDESNLLYSTKRAVQEDNHRSCATTGWNCGPRQARHDRPLQIRRRVCS